MKRLELQHVAVFDSEHEGGLQQQAYLGNNEQLLQHMRDKGITTMTTQSVTSWLKKNGGFPLGYQNVDLTVTLITYFQILLGAKITLTITSCCQRGSTAASTGGGQRRSKFTLERRPQSRPKTFSSGSGKKAGD